jgi:hypothetical protein
LSKVYNPDSAGKERTRLTKTILLCLRGLMEQSEPTSETNDMVSYIILSLEAISQNIDVSVEAWEKRGYWVKADKFRLEWEWTAIIAKQLREALLIQDWGSIAIGAAKTAQKLGKVKVPVKNRMGTPWVGAYKVLGLTKKTASK